jgi:hypothetical protein
MVEQFAFSTSRPDHAWSHRHYGFCNWNFFHETFYARKDRHWYSLDLHPKEEGNRNTMINIRFLLIASAILAYLLLTLLFLLGLCRAAARATSTNVEAKPLSNTPTGAPLTGIPEQIGISIL